jgi:uncharacterized heparinase superfamily protein
MDYGQSRQVNGRSRRDLRPLSDLARHGIRLVEGKVTCVTCHDGRSRVAGHLALPPGSVARPTASPLVRAGIEERGPELRVEDLPQGSAVSPTPLCMACHAFD